MTNLDYYRIASSLFAQAQTGNWQRCVRHVVPRLISVSALTEMPDDGLPHRICSRAKTDLLKYAAAHVSFIMPRGVNWFSLGPTDESDSVDVKDWFKRATQAVQRELEKSNFYPCMDTQTLDHAATGTGAALAEFIDNALVFTHIPMGTYAMAENEVHRIDTFVRKFHMTPHQLAQKFEFRKLSTKMQSAYRSHDKRYSDQFEVWHLVVPRDIADQGNYDLYANPKLMPFASVYIEPTTKTVLLEEGCPEFPYLVTRWRKYSNQVFGESILANCVDQIEDCIQLEESINRLAKLQADPRTLVPADLVEELDMNAGGVTVLPPNYDASSVPREWASGGRLEGLVQLREQDHAEIDACLYTDVLQTVSQVERTMSATEVQAREREKLMTYAGSFAQYTADLTPFMDRIFCLLLRHGKLPQENMPTEQLLRTVGENKMRVLAPGVSYLGRLAKALEANKQQGLQEALSYASQMAAQTQDMAWMDLFKTTECMRYMTDESNVPSECLRTPKEARAIAEQRQAAIVAQQQAAMAAQLAQADNSMASADAQRNG